MDTITEECIKYITKRFEEICDSSLLITLDQFKKLYKPLNVSKDLARNKKFMKTDKLFKYKMFLFQPFFVERIFAIFDTNKKGIVTLDKTISIFRELSRLDDDGKVKFLLKIYNVNGNYTVVL